MMRKKMMVEMLSLIHIFPVLENTDFELDEQPYSSLFAIYQKELLDVSASTGLIHSDALALACLLYTSVEESRSLLPEP